MMLVAGLILTCGALTYYSVWRRVHLPALILLLYTLLGELRLSGQGFLGLSEATYPYHLVFPVVLLFPCLWLLQRLKIDRTVFRYSVLHLAFLIFVVIAMMHAWNSAYGLALFKTYAMGLLIIWLLYWSIRTKKQLRAVLHILFAVTSIGAVLGLLQDMVSTKLSVAYLAKGASWFDRWGWAPVGYSNAPHQFGHDMLIGVLPAIALWWIQSSRKGTQGPTWLLPIIVLGLAGLILSTNLSSWLGLAVGLAFLVLHGKRLAVKRVVTAGIAAAVLILVPLSGVIETAVGSLRSPEGIMNNYRVETRLTLLQSGLAMVGENPLLGKGAGAFHALVPDYTDRELRTRYPHNVFLGLAAEIGIPGAIAFGLLILFPFLSLEKLKPKLELTDPFLESVVLGLQAVYIGYVIDASFHNYFIDLHLWFLIGLGMASIVIAKRRLLHGESQATDGEAASPV